MYVIMFASVGAQAFPRTKFWECLKTFLVNHFSEEDAVKIMECMKQVGIH